jgi:HEPN domain-containing protein
VNRGLNLSLSPKEEANRWLLHAERDLGFARLGIELGGFYAQTCFMAHQSAEKALKSLLYLRGARYIGESSISELLKRAADASPGLGRYQDMSARLDRYYSAARYLSAASGGAPSETPGEVLGEAQAKEVVAEGENLILEIRNIIRTAR